jgi:hypothetical protein
MSYKIEVNEVPSRTSGTPVPILKCAYSAFKSKIRSVSVARCTRNMLKSTSPLSDVLIAPAIRNLGIQHLLARVRPKGSWIRVTGDGSPDSHL